MQFDLSKPQKLFAGAVREFCQREFPAERVRELMETEDGIDDRLWQEFADQGWLGLHVAEENEGLGLGIVDLAVLAEEFGRACVSGPWLTVTWAATLLQAIGGESASRHLPGIVDGSLKVAVAALEESGSWSVSAEYLETTLDGGRLNGHKHLVQHAGQAAHLLLPVRQDDQLALLMIPTDHAGVSVERTPGMDATRTLYHVALADVAVTEDQVLCTGETAESAWKQALRTMTVVIAAEMLGLQQWMLEETVEYAKTRKQFDRTIGSFQAIQHMCAEMLQLTENARAAVWYAAWAEDEGIDDVDQAVAVAKACTSDAVRQSGNLAVQVHGGIGFTWEHDLQLYYKRAKADELLFGDASFHRRALGTAALAPG